MLINNIYFEPIYRHLTLAYIFFAQIRLLAIVNRVNSEVLFLQIQYEITRIRQKMKELANLHDKHMNRPTLDDSSEEEHAIEITTQEITQV